MNSDRGFGGTGSGLGLRAVAGWCCHSCRLVGWTTRGVASQIHNGTPSIREVGRMGKLGFGIWDRRGETAWWLALACGGLRTRLIEWCALHGQAEDLATLRCFTLHTSSPFTCRWGDGMGCLAVQSGQVRGEGVEVVGGNGKEGGRVSR